VIVQDFEQNSAMPTVWVVNIPNENASLHLSTDNPHDGKSCLKLHYHFVAPGEFRYLGIDIKTKISAPIHKLHFWLNGDNSKCSYGLRLNDSADKTHQYSKNTGQGGIIDFEGWREMVFDLDAGHETWGGDKTGQIEYPITSITLCISQPTENNKPLAAEGDLNFDTLSVDSSKSAAATLGSQISVVSPEYCSEIKGETTIVLSAPGFSSLTAKCWKQGPGFGVDSTIAKVDLDAHGSGSFVFPADAYPHGPITVRIIGDNGDFKDNCYLQFYNHGGVSWNEGMPHDPPPAAQGMSLVFADDFTGSLSISGSDPQATYYDHKPPDGSQDFSRHTFADHASPQNPFFHIDSYLRIRASDKLHSSGLISSLKRDSTGITAKAPCYFECRFIGPNAIGTWPAFWLLTEKTVGDELDIIEAYGGEGPHEPNASDGYMITPHCWNQGETGKAIERAAFDGMHNPIHVRKFGIPST
jgi:hypothetical protein